VNLLSAKCFADKYFKTDTESIANGSESETGRVAVVEKDLGVVGLLVGRVVKDSDEVERVGR